VQEVISLHRAKFSFIYSYNDVKQQGPKAQEN